MIFQTNYIVPLGKCEFISDNLLPIYHKEPNNNRPTCQGRVFGNNSEQVDMSSDTEIKNSEQVDMSSDSEINNSGQIDMSSDNEIQNSGQIDMSSIMFKN